ncbi:MAG: sulfurtransferase [Chloroflexota bacterium]
MTDAIVTTEWLAQHIDDDILRIVDIRGYVKPATEPPPHYFNKRDDYEQSHIPGAVFIDWVHEITDPDLPHHTQVAPPERYKAAMERAGIGDDTFVVIYDDGGSIFAPRLWWTLQYYGHTAAAVMDGGFKKWVDEGRPVTADIPDVPAVTFTPSANPSLRRTGEQVLNGLASDSVIIDVRSDKEYNGQASRAPRGGHIPGATHNHRSTIMNEDGTLKSPDEIRAHFEGIGVTDDAPEVIFYCNAGVSASYSLLAYKLAGFSNGTLYDASWKEWGNDDSKPIET